MLKLLAFGPITRLLLCLLLSVSAHGLLFLPGMNFSHLANRQNHKPVFVNFLKNNHSQNSPQVAAKKPLSQTAAKARVVNPSEDDPAPFVADKKIKTSEPEILPTEEPERAPEVSLPLDRNLPASIDVEAESLAQPVQVEDSLMFNDVSPDDSDSLQQNFQESESFSEAVPDYRHNPKPEYPSLAGRKKWQGVVWLLVDVTSDGQVKDLSVEQSSGYRVLDRAAARTVRTWMFYPAKRAGIPVASRVRIPIRFQLKGS